MNKPAYSRFSLALFLAGAGLRILLFLANPAWNSFDNHFEPISLIMSTGAIPHLNSCFECYQPPVFYAISAFFAQIVLVFGITGVYLVKVLQSLSCFYGILHLAVIYLILRKLPLSDFARIIAFATVCFLPQHIYISAMNSNDTISYLAVSFCLYLFLAAYEWNLALPWLVLLSIAVTATIFTKYTALAIIPAMMLTLVIMRLRRAIVSTKKMLIAAGVIFLLPLACLGFYCASNVRNYGSALPWNNAILNPAQTQPKAEKINFFDFHPAGVMKNTIIYPGILGSFWTQLYAKMWFDFEPKFLYFTDRNDSWWDGYYRWIRGEAAFPAGVMRFSLFTRFLEFCLLMLGLVPLLLLIAGIVRLRDIKMLIFPLLLLFNLAVVIWLTVVSPVYSSMKAVYLLNSLPAMAVLIAAGTMWFERYIAAKRVICVFFTLLPALVIAHILHIVWSAGFFSL